MSENKNINLVFKSRNNILEILKFRGFNVDNYIDYSINEIHLLIESKQLDMLVKNETTGQKVYLKYFTLDKSLRPNNVHEIIDSLFNIEEVLNKNDELIIIIKEEPNETLEKLQISQYEHDNIYFNIININRLQFNILKHSLVPKHRVLSDEEKNNIKKQKEIDLMRKVFNNVFSLSLNTINKNEFFFSIFRTFLYFLKYNSTFSNEKYNLIKRIHDYVLNISNDHTFKNIIKVPCIEYEICLRKLKKLS